MLALSLLLNIYQAWTGTALNQRIAENLGEELYADDLAAQNNLHAQMATTGFRVNWVNCSPKTGYYSSTQICDVNGTTEPWFTRDDSVAIDAYLNRTFFASGGLKPRSIINLSLECRRADVGRAGACHLLSSKTEPAPPSFFEPSQ